MKKLIFAAVLSAFAIGSVNAAYACDGQHKSQNKGTENTQAKKDNSKKTDEAAKTDQKS